VATGGHRLLRFRAAPAALVWALRSGSETFDSAIIESIIVSGGYYAERARGLTSGAQPFERRESDLADTVEQDTGDAWEFVGWSEAGDAGEANATFQAVADDRFERGKLLWTLGLRRAAQQEFNDLRLAYASDPVESLALALAFRDMADYRSSILAAKNVLDSSGADFRSAPSLIGELAYPIYYADEVQKVASEYDLDPLLLFSLIRQESLFDYRAKSHASAYGLTQVIPSTGAAIAERLEVLEFDPEMLYEPSMSLEFGAYYLAEQLEWFDGDSAAALAAYNGGPGNTLRWKRISADDFDYLVETITLSETRRYVTEIFIGHTAYSYLYGQVGD